MENRKILRRSCHQRSSNLDEFRFTFGLQLIRFFCSTVFNNPRGILATSSATLHQTRQTHQDPENVVCSIDESPFPLYHIPLLYPLEYRFNLVRGIHPASQIFSRAIGDVICKFINLVSELKDPVLSKTIQSCFKK